MGTAQELGEKVGPGLRDSLNLLPALLQKSVRNTTELCEYLSKRLFELYLLSPCAKVQCKYSYNLSERNMHLRVETSTVQASCTIPNSF